MGAEYLEKTEQTLFDSIFLLGFTPFGVTWGVVFSSNRSYFQLLLST